MNVTFNSAGGNVIPVSFSVKDLTGTVLFQLSDDLSVRAWCLPDIQVTGNLHQSKVLVSIYHSLLFCFLDVNVLVSCIPGSCLRSFRPACFCIRVCRDRYALRLTGRSRKSAFFPQK